MEHRRERANSLIREELGKIMIREVEFPSGVLPTITEVVTNEKVDTSDVLISVIPDRRGAEVLKILENRRGELQHLLIKKLNMKPVPAIRFVLDHGLEHAAHVEKLLLEDEGGLKNNP